MEKFKKIAAQQMWLPHSHPTLATHVLCINIYSSWSPN